jgi:predicted amidophosphoribosyltransferase
MRLQETSITIDHTSYRYHYLCHYLPLAAGIDTLSRSLMKFKRGAYPDLHAWIDCAREALAENPPSRDSIIVRALGHRETIIKEDARPTSLDLLGRTLAADFHCRYLPALLSKTRETWSNKTLSRKEREIELHDVYSANVPFIPASSASDLPAPSASPERIPPPSPSFLLIDDILTTGATIRAMIGALKCTPLPIRVFTLARAAHDPQSYPIAPLQSRNYYLDQDAGWVLANSF